MEDKLSELFHKCAYEIEYDTIGNSVNYKFIEKNNTLYVYFQGSNSDIDWVRNFFFLPIKRKTPYKEMFEPYKVHAGFLSAWKEMEDLFISKITEKCDRKKYNPRTKKMEIRNTFKWDKVIVVGYSHGAALTQFACESLWYYRKDLIKDGFKCYAFEAPRIFAQYHVPKILKERWDNLLVIRTNNDIVTHVPPKLLGYSNLGTMLKVKGDCSLVDNKLLNCIKSHFPEVVYDALIKYEAE